MFDSKIRNKDISILVKEYLALACECFTKFPDSYDDLFTVPWKERAKKFAGKITFSDVRMLRGNLESLVRCSGEAGEDANVSHAVSFVERAYEKGKDFLMKDPVCIPFREPYAPMDSFLRDDNRSKILHMFFTDDAFGRYRKGCSNLAQPNVYEEASIEFGRLIGGKNWKRTSLQEATHVGVYFQSSYLSSHFVKECAWRVDRTWKSSRHTHTWSFCVQKLDFEVSSELDEL